MTHSNPSFAELFETDRRVPDNLDPLASIGAQGVEEVTGEAVAVTASRFEDAAGRGDRQEIERLLAGIVASAETTKNRTALAETQLRMVFAETAKVYAQVGMNERAILVAAGGSIAIDRLLSADKLSDVMTFFKMATAMLEEARHFKAAAMAQSHNKKAMEDVRKTAEKLYGAGAPARNSDVEN